MGRQRRADSGLLDRRRLVLQAGPAHHLQRVDQQQRLIDEAQDDFLSVALDLSSPPHDRVPALSFTTCGGAIPAGREWGVGTSPPVGSTMDPIPFFWCCKE